MSGTQFAGRMALTVACCGIIARAMLTVRQTDLGVVGSLLLMAAGLVAIDRYVWR